jgi:tricorn protease
VLITVGDAKGKSPRTVAVKTLATEQPARYREWVETNRRIVHERTKDRVGYVHIPDMGPHGFSEFHRYFLSEIDREGLVVDVRFNGGGHVSELILEKLARRRIGWAQSRWFNVTPYPVDSVGGPMVALANEYAGSDGDIFSHGFKLLKLGPLIGKRTWGGVIGIWPRHPLIDGGFTTQPEFSFWFKDVGWNVENYGTEPDIEVEFRPQDYAAGRDPQLERALQEITKLLRKNPPLRPDLRERPDRSWPRLPAKR